MTRETIIEIIERAFERELHWEAKATDELFELIKQEKREQVREILQDLKDMMIIPDFTLHLILNTLSQKYGVKL